MIPVFSATVSIFNNRWAALTKNVVMPKGTIIKVSQKSVTAFKTSVLP